MVRCHGSLHSHQTASVSESRVLMVLLQYLGDAVLIQTLASIVWLSSYIPLPPPRITRIAIGIKGSISDSVTVKITDHGNAWV